MARKLNGVITDEDLLKFNVRANLFYVKCISRARAERDR